MTGDDEQTVYIEGIEASEEAADIDLELVVENSDGDPVASDLIKLTIVSPALSEDGEAVTKDTDGNYYVYIDDTPAMPNLAAQLKPDDLTGTVTWQLKIEYQRDNREDEDVFPESGETTLAASEAWNIHEEFGDKIRGGKATLSYEWERDGEIIEGELVFHIRGENPTEDAAKNYLDQPHNGVNPPWFIKRIAKQESGTQKDAETGEDRSYLQFNETGTLGPEWENDVQFAPNWGYPHGWGMMQIEDPDAAGILWEWHENVDKAKEKLEAMRIEADSGADDFWERQVEQFQLWQANHPEVQEPPPEGPDGYKGITFTYDEDYTTDDGDAVYSYRDAIWIKQYNGAQGGNFISWKNDEGFENNPFWKFNRTRADGTNYVQKVCNQTP